MDDDLDYSKLKYVLYARKSTDDPQRQVRSIGDQIFECKQLATRLGLNIAMVLEETKSAKKPNKLCIRKKKSIRAKEIFNWIYDFLKGGLGLTEEDYKRYYNRLIKITDNAREKVGIEIHSLQGRLKVIKQEIKERSLELGKQNMLPTVKKANEDRVIELEAEREDIEGKITRLQEKLTNPEDDRLSIEQFLNLSKNAGAIIQSADAVIKDTICREIFLNLTVDEQKVLSYQLKPHFAEMLKSKQQPTSRRPGN